MKKKEELLDGKGCKFNDRKERVCQGVEPGGSGLGGCAFDGAQIVLVPITDAAHLVHAPPGCGGTNWNTRGSLSSGSLLYKRGFSTHLRENDIIFGSEEKLEKSIDDTLNRFAPSALFVYATCVTALTGNDIVSICVRKAKEKGLPVIPVEAPGFAGSKNFGNRMAGEVLLNHVIGTIEPEPDLVTPYDMNIIGEYNIAGELWKITPLLKKLNIRVQAVLTGNSRYSQIASCHRAKLNVMVCSRALINVARGMEEQYGIPYIEESFYGSENTSRALQNIARHLGGQKLEFEAKVLTGKETVRLETALEPYRKVLKGKRVVLYTGGVKSWSAISALQDLGVEVIACGTRKSTPDDIDRMKKLLGKEAILLKESGPKTLLKMVREKDAHMIVAGGRNLYISLKAKIPYLDINQDRELPYTGYEGMINLAKMMCTSLMSPVWEKVRRKRPW